MAQSNNVATNPQPNVHVDAPSSEIGAQTGRERQRLIAALGCQTCEQGKYFRMRAVVAEGKAFTGGGPIGLVPHEAPTRFRTMMEVFRG